MPGGAAIRRWPVAPDLIFADPLLNWIRIGLGHHAAETHAEGEQVTDGDGAARGHRVVDFRGDGFSGRGDWRVPAATARSNRRGAFCNPRSGSSRRPR